MRDSGSELTVRDDLRIGSAGTRNYLTVTNGASVFANRLFIGNGSNSNSVTVANGNLIVTNTITVTCGALSLNSGFVKADRLALPSSTKSKLTFNGGTLQTHSITGAVFQQTIGNGVSPATFEMLGAGTNSFSPGGFVMVSSNAFIKGNGTIDGDVSLMAGATISPGASIGTIGVLGYLALANGSTTDMELDATTGACDRINVSGGGLVYGGTLQLTNISGALTNGQSFTLFTSSLGYSGRFTNIVPASPAAGLKWNTNGLKIDGTLRVAAVPTRPPVLAAPTFNGSNLSVAASGGNAFDPCYLLSSTNALMPFASWTRVKTNLFNSSGGVSFIIPASLGDQQRYFTVQVQ